MKKIIWDANTQKDFMDINGKCYISGSEYIKENIKNVLLTAQDNDIDIFGCVEANELKQYPISYCLINTPGQDKIPESIVSHIDNIYFIPNNGNGFDMNIFEGAQQIYFEKQTIDIWDKCFGQPDNIQTMLRMLDVTDIYIIGVLLNFDIICGFIQRKYNVSIIMDATISNIENKLIIDKIKSIGGHIIFTNDFIQNNKYNFKKG